MKILIRYIHFHFKNYFVFNISVKNFISNKIFCKFLDETCL